MGDHRLHGASGGASEICVLHGWDSLHCNGNATGPSRPVEPTRPCAVCFVHYGNCMGVSWRETSSLLPAIMEALGLFPVARHGIGAHWSVRIHLRTDRQQLLLHALDMAHHGGYECRVPLTTA